MQWHVHNNLCFGAGPQGTQIVVAVAVNGVWHETQLGVAASAYAWTPFALAVSLPVGEVELRSRATDASGVTQPDSIEWNSLGYGNNAVRAVRVVVR